LYFVGKGSLDIHIWGKPKGVGSTYWFVSCINVVIDSTAETKRIFSYQSLKLWIIESRPIVKQPSSIILSRGILICIGIVQTYKRCIPKRLVRVLRLNRARRISQCRSAPKSISKEVLRTANVGAQEVLVYSARQDICGRRAAGNLLD